MAGRHDFRGLSATLAPEAQARAAVLTEAWDQALSLAELRRARALTQEQLAGELHIGQAAIARLERRTDMYLSTLRKFVVAMGGDLELVARFPDHPPVRVRLVAELADGG